MALSPNIGLTLTPESEISKRFIDFRTELAGDSDGSNMMIIDAEIQAVKDRCGSLEDTPFTWGMLKNGFSGT